jgi:Arc/MetJ-type ribon-helix-helix transcriptional regulator
MRYLKVPITLTITDEALAHLNEWVEEDGFGSLDEMISYLTQDSLINDLEEKLRVLSPKDADEFRADIEAVRNKALQ